MMKTGEAQACWMGTSKKPVKIRGIVVFRGTRGHARSLKLETGV